MSHEIDRHPVLFLRRVAAGSVTAPAGRFAGSSAAGQQVHKTIAVGPALVVDAPGDVEFSIQISPTVKTHELRVYAESESYYRSTTIGLDGLDSTPVHHFTWRSFPVGEYQVVGMLVDDDGSEEIIVRSSLKVINR